MSDALIRYTTIGSLCALLAALLAVALGPDLWWRLRHRKPAAPPRPQTRGGGPDEINHLIPHLTWLEQRLGYRRSWLLTRSEDRS